MARWFFKPGLTLVFPLIVSLTGALAGGCNQLLDITSITAVDGAVMNEGSGGNNGSAGNNGSGGNNASGGNNGSGGNDGSGGNNASGGNNGSGGKDGSVTSDGGVDQASDHQSGNNYCDRAFWKATASVPGAGAGPPAGIDGDLATRWSTQRYQDGTDWYQVNFGGPVTLTKITLNDTTIQPDNFPGNYEVYGSSNGTTFDSTPFATGAGTTNSTVISFPRVTVSAVKIKQVGTANSLHWWGICEFQVACQL